MSLLESWIDVFRFNRPGAPNLDGRVASETLSLQGAEQIIDFGVDYVNANISYLRNTTLTPNRYSDYALMDKHPLINSSLDIIAAEGTQSDENGKTIFVRTFTDSNEVEEDEEKQKALTRETEMLHKHLEHFVYAVTGNHLYLQFRNYIKNGDLVLVPIYSEDKKKILRYAIVPNENVKLVIDAETYSITKYIVTPPDDKTAPIHNFSRFLKADEYRPDDVYHFTLDPENSTYFPYGMSILDSVSLMFKQLRLLEDSMLIYRITRSPDRRIFYVDVGELPPQKAEKYLNDIRTKFIRKNFFDPQTGDVNNEYNPLSMQEDLYIPRRPGGAETQVETMPGLSIPDHTDVLYFRDQIILGLKIPPSYVSATENAQYNDGRVGIAYINEIRFANYVETLQRSFVEQFERYFRKYLKRNGVETKLRFTLEMFPPSSYKEYQENELKLSNISNYSQLAGNEELAMEFLQEKYLGLTPEEIQRNKDLLKIQKENEPEEDSDELDHGEEQKDSDAEENEPTVDHEDNSINTNNTAGGSEQ